VSAPAHSDWPPRAGTRLSRTGRIARRWLARPGVVFLDTETTGLGQAAEVCEIAIIDRAGAVLLEQRIRPVQPIPSEATRVHGISDADVADCPTWADIAPTLARVLHQRPVVVYNAAYDLRLMAQSAQRHGLPPPLGNALCAMLLYAEHHGERDDLRGGYRWQKLGAAARQLGLALPPDLHSARADAALTRQLLVLMASAT
jgi:DNA polymerase-3 subunit epsilon